MASTLNGINAMPAKGTCMTCTDADLQAAVEYMVDGSR
jgi:cytochrome c5